MNSSILFAVALVASVTAKSQNTSEYISCSGLEKIPVKTSVVVNGLIQKEFVQRKDFATSNLFIILSDTSYKIVGFKLSHDCDDCFLIDIPEKTYLGNKIPAGDRFISNARVGQHLYFDCITVEKNRKRYIVASIFLEIQ